MVGDPRSGHFGREAQQGVVAARVATDLDGRNGDGPDHLEPAFRREGEAEKPELREPHLLDERHVALALQDAALSQVGHPSDHVVDVGEHFPGECRGDRREQNRLAHIARAVAGDSDTADVRAVRRLGLQGQDKETKEEEPTSHGIGS